MFDYQDAMRQAPMTIETYLGEVVRMLDERFGPGFAAENPRLVGTLVLACTNDYNTAAQTILAKEK